MPKSRTLEEDKGILRKKIQEAASQDSGPETRQRVRALRKRLKRVQRKIRSIKQRQARSTPSPA